MYYKQILYLEQLSLKNNYKSYLKGLLWFFVLLFTVLLFSLALLYIPSQYLLAFFLVLVLFITFRNAIPDLIPQQALFLSHIETTRFLDHLKKILARLLLLVFKSKKLSIREKQFYKKRENIKNRQKSRKSKQL